MHSLGLYVLMHHHNRRSDGSMHSLGYNCSKYQHIVKHFQNDNNNNNNIRTIYTAQPLKGRLITTR